MAINVGPGNRTHNPENPAARRPHWRLTWIALAVFLLFVLVFIAASSMDRGPQESPYAPGTPAQESLQRPGQPGGATPR
jgi:hypothetical protein